MKRERERERERERKDGKTALTWGSLVTSKGKGIAIHHMT